MITILQTLNDNRRLAAVTDAVTNNLLRKYLPKTGKFLDLTDGFFKPFTDSCEMVCNADLSTFENDTFDAVIVNGRFSRMKFRADRCRFVNEALRVLKPDGIFAFDFISPEAMQFVQHMAAMKSGDKMMFRKLTTVEQTSVMDDVRATSMEEIAAHARAHCADILTTAAVCSTVPSFAYSLNQMDVDELESYIDHQIKICEDHFVARYAIQGMCIFQKKPYDEFS